MEEIREGMGSKRIKVVYTMRDKRRKSPWQSGRYEELPKIQMEGKWLEALGFHVGDRLKVEYGEGRICITHAEQTEGRLSPLMVAEPVCGYGPAGKRG